MMEEEGYCIIQHVDDEICFVGDTFPHMYKTFGEARRRYEALSTEWCKKACEHVGDIWTKRPPRLVKVSFSEDLYPINQGTLSDIKKIKDSYEQKKKQEVREYDRKVEFLNDQYEQSLKAIVLDKSKSNVNL